MITRNHHHPSRILGVALAALLALTLAASACGGSGDDDGKSGSADAAAVRTEPRTEPPPRKEGAEEIDYIRAQELADKDNEEVGGGRTDEGQIGETLEDVQVSIAEANGASVCHELTEAAELAVARSGRSSDPRACSDVVRRVAQERRRRGSKTALSEVLSVKLRGNEATARVRYPDGSVRFIPFVKEGGIVWKASSLDLIDELIVENPPEGPGHDFTDPHDVGDRAVIREVLYDSEGDFPRELGQSVCHELTPRGQREIVPRARGLYTCEDRMEPIARRALAGGYQPLFSEFRSIRIDGKRATAVVKSPGRKARTVRFVETADGWKLPSVRYIGVDSKLLSKAPAKPDAGTRAATLRHDFGDEETGNPHAAIREVISDIQADFAEGIGSSCHELSERGQREISGQTSGRTAVSKCTPIASQLSRRVRSSKTVRPWRSRVTDIRIDGRRATAVLVTPGVGRHKARFLKERLKGWRLESLRYAEPVARWIDR